MTFELMAASCDGGDCPTFFLDRASGTVRVRGYDPHDSAREVDVDIPATAWARLVAQINQ